MSGRKVYWNGQFVPEEDARLSIYDSALMFGDMVFEMTRSFQKKQFKLIPHLERLYASMKHVQIQPTMTLEQLEKAVYETVEVNDALFKTDDEHRIMINVSRGLLGIYAGNVDLPAGPNVIIADFPLRWTVKGMGKLFDEGIHARIPNQRAIPENLLDPKVKNRSRLHYMMANIQVADAKEKNVWALLLDPDGYVAEGSGDNFFIIKDNAIITPEPRNILCGISRAYVMNELSQGLGLPVVEKNIIPEDVAKADEAFMTATPFCLLPVTHFEGVAIGNGLPGRVTQQLLELWSQNVGVDIVGQIKVWDSTSDLTSQSAPSPYAFKGAS